MLPKVVAIALSIDILLTCLEGCASAFFSFLPLGRSHLAQLGLVLGIAVAIFHIVDALHARPSQKS
jgi:hypothetical protein